MVFPARQKTVRISSSASKYAVGGDRGTRAEGKGEKTEEEARAKVDVAWEAQDGGEV